MPTKCRIKKVPEEPRYPKRFEAACRALERYLKKYLPPLRGYVFKVYASDHVDGSIRIDTVSETHRNKEGWFWSRFTSDLPDLAFILTAEDYVRTYKVKEDAWDEEANTHDAVKYRLLKVGK